MTRRRTRNRADRAPRAATLGLLTLLCLAFCGPTACSRPKSQEQRVRETIEQIDAAASAKSASELRAHISESYLDAKKRTKADIAGFITYFIFNQKDVHSFSIVYDVDLTGVRTARAEVYAALAATPIKTSSDIPRLHADLWRFDLTLTLEPDDVWRVSAADWEPVDLDRLEKVVF